MHKFVIGNMLICLNLLLISCSGYKVSKSENPFQNYGISSLSVPLFVNKSSLQGVSPEITKQIISTLSRYKNLRIVTGQDSLSDALLVGIISSKSKINEAKNVTSTKFTSGDLKSSIGSRPEFFVPASIAYDLNVQVVIIKNPNWADKKMVIEQKTLPVDVLNQPNIVVNNRFEISSTYRQSSEENTDVDKGGSVDSTKTLGNYYISLQELALNFASQFKNEVLDVF